MPLSSQFSLEGLDEIAATNTLVDEHLSKMEVAVGKSDQKVQQRYSTKLLEEGVTTYGSKDQKVSNIRYDLGISP